MELRALFGIGGNLTQGKVLIDKLFPAHDFFVTPIQPQIHFLGFLAGHIDALLDLHINKWRHCQSHNIIFTRDFSRHTECVIQTPRPIHS